MLMSEAEPSTASRATRISRAEDARIDTSRRRRYPDEVMPRTLTSSKCGRSPRASKATTSPLPGVSEAFRVPNSKLTRPPPPSALAATSSKLDSEKLATQLPLSGGEMAPEVAWPTWEGMPVVRLSME